MKGSDVKACDIFKEKKKVQKKHLFEIEIFCNILFVFTVTFDRFNAS